MTSTASLVQLPDTEALVISALAAMPELAALGSRIYSVVPKQRTFPLARVFRFGGDPLYTGDPYWLDNPSVQVDLWADGGMVEARALAEMLRACCAQRLAGTYSSGVISSVRVSALVQSADSTFNPPKPRYRFTAQLIVRPVREAPDPPPPDLTPRIVTVEPEQCSDTDTPLALTISGAQLSTVRNVILMLGLSPFPCDSVVATESTITCTTMPLDAGLYDAIFNAPGFGNPRLTGVLLVEPSP